MIIDGVVSDLSNPYLSLGLRTNIKLKDLLSVNTTLKTFVSALAVDGEVHSKISFDGPLKQPENWKAYGEFSSSALRIHKFLFNGCSFQASFVDNKLIIPEITAQTYAGTTTMSFQADFNYPEHPFLFNISADNIDLNKTISDLNDPTSMLFGKMFLTLNLTGSLKDINLLKGSGYFIVNDANLGLMPIFTPFLHDVHQFLTKTSRSLDEISITGAECNIQIRDQKVFTNNLWFWGNILNIYGKGYIGFNKDIYFEMTNEIKELPEDSEDWQKDLIQFMATVGKVLGKAYVTGTLDDYQWEFDFFSGWQGNIARNIQKFINNMMEQ
jgi:hypothetical protein